MKKSGGETSKQKELSKKSQSFDSLSEKTIEVDGAEDYVLISKNESKSKSVDVLDKDEVEQEDPTDPFRSPVPAQNFALLKVDSIPLVAEEEEEVAVVASSVGMTEAVKPEKQDGEENAAVSMSVSTTEEVIEEKHGKFIIRHHPSRQTFF